jgi:hypothetical protein
MDAERQPRADSEPDRKPGVEVREEYSVPCLRLAGELRPRLQVGSIPPDPPPWP